MTKRLIVLLVLSTALPIAASAQTKKRPSLLRMFGRQTDAEARPIDGELTQEAGPFLILAETLVGKGAKERAEKLAAEIRRDMKLPVFIYNENFDFTKTVSFDPQTARRTKYANSYQYEAYAVLVGEYDSVSHPAIEDDLNRIKRATPSVLEDAEEMAAEIDESTPVTTLKSITTRILQGARSQGKDFGPMAHAFVTRNPMLPADYFKAPPVDSFVQQLNENDQHSLLDCDAKYTVIVKTFRGSKKILDSADDLDFEGSQRRMNKLKRQADKMVKDLRSRGVEAYQYHDRERSLVCIGAFNELGKELPGGKFQYNEGIRQVMSRYSALNVQPELARQVPGGVRGIAANAAALIPFDVQPTPIVIPKLSKKSLYGMKR